VVAKHIRSELGAAGFQLLESEMTNRVIYAESALWGATPSLIESTGPAARDIAAIAAEVDQILAIKQAA
jgi:chromosome partitioning protein